MKRVIQWTTHAAAEAADLGAAELRQDKAATGRAKDALDLELLGPPRRARTRRR